MRQLFWWLVPLLLLCTPLICYSATNIMENVHRIVFLGDSLTDGADWADWVVNTLQTDKHYHHLVGFNAGVGGDRIGDMKARLAADVLAQHPDLVVLLAGANDVLQKVDIEKYRQQMDDVVKTLRDRKIHVLLLTLPTVVDKDTSLRLAEYNVVIRAVAAKYHCPIADTRDAFEKAVAAGVVPNGPDGVHHSHAGWLLMGNTVLRALGGKMPLQELVKQDEGIVSNWYISPAMKTEVHPTPSAECLATFDPLKAGWTKYQTADEKKTCIWWRAGSFDRGAVYPFGDPKRVNDQSAYACATVDVDKHTVMTMRVGGNNPLIVWLNGKQVWYGVNWHGWHSDTDRFPVTLSKGENHILVYSSSLFYIALTK